jgi:hypothetical protein
MLKRIHRRNTAEAVAAPIDPMNNCRLDDLLLSIRAPLAVMDDAIDPTSY